MRRVFPNQLRLMAGESIKLGSLFHLNDADSTLAIRVDDSAGMAGMLVLGDGLVYQRMPSDAFGRQQFAGYANAAYTIELLAPPRALAQRDDYRNLAAIDERGLCLIAGDGQANGQECVQVCTVDWLADPLPRVPGLRFVERWRLLAADDRGHDWQAVAGVG